MAFIHIPKCGGSSIAVMLTGSDDPGAYDDVDSIVFRNNPKIKKSPPLSHGRYGRLNEYEH